MKKKEEEIYAVIIINPQLCRFYRRGQFGRFKKYVERGKISSLPLRFKSETEYANFVAGYEYALPKECMQDTLILSSRSDKATRYMLELIRNWNPRYAGVAKRYLVYLDEPRQEMKRRFDSMAQACADQVFLDREQADLFIKTFNSIFQTINDDNK